MDINIKRDRKQKFVMLAEKRVNRLLNDIKLVSNLANRSNYDYSQEQANKIIKAIEAEVKFLKLAFSRNKKTKNAFKL
jgi:hypothetical protein